jgi:hemolysin activation/secretion protein
MWDNPRPTREESPVSMSMRLVVLSLILAASPSFAATRSLTAIGTQPAAVPTITGYELVADPAVEAQVAGLKDQLMKNVGQPFARARVEADVKLFQDLGTVAMVRTAQRPYKGGTKLCYRVEANPVIREIRLEGLTVLDPAELVGTFQSRAGQVLDYTVLYSDLNRIPERCLAEKGVMYVDVIDPKDVTVEDGVVTARVREFTMGELTIEGCSGAHAQLVRRTFQPVAGKPILRRALLASLCDIYQLSTVKDLDWNPKFDRENNRVNINLMVTPADETQASKPTKLFVDEKGE